MGEREDVLNENQYGKLNMRPYVIDGNDINAFYDDSDDLIFVLDNTISQTKPNVLLVINPDGDKKWDEILSGQYDVDLETIRPKQDNKYQKLDIEYSGLSVYENLIRAFVAGDDLDEHLIQLNILRDSAARHSAMTRLNVANDIISKTNVTIVRTKDSIVRLQNRIKTLRTKLSETKKEIGKVSTKQSAAKILKLESQIEATNEKLKRAQKRLESAQKRLETATVDAELASDLLNQPALEIQNVTKNKPVIVAPKYEMQTTESDSDDEPDNNDDYEEDDDYEDNEDADNEIKPLFDENPNNLNEDIAFKPISFDMPTVQEIKTDKEQKTITIPEPIFTDSDKDENYTEEEFVAPDITSLTEQKTVLESMVPVMNEENKISESGDQKSVLESITPITEMPVEQDVAPIYSEQSEITEQISAPVQKPANPLMPAARTVAPVVNTFNADVTPENSRSKPTIVYYILLVILIALSVFTLWLYQKNIGTTEPLLTADVVKPGIVDTKPIRLKAVQKPQKEVKPVVATVTADKSDEFEFVENENIVTEPADNQAIDNEVIEPDSNVSAQPTEPVEPVIIDAVPAKILTASETNDDDEYINADNQENINKPEYGAGSKHDAMFISEQDYQPSVAPTKTESDEDLYFEEEYYEE